MQQTNRTAFTLVEMSIVLVVIGLIIGGVAAGTSVLRQSEIKTVLADYGKYSAAANQFNQQYGSWPGDIPDATNYWGKNTTFCNADTQPAGSPGTCNGDGNGMIGFAAGAVNLTESVLAWQHLQLAKLVTGNYSISNTVVIGTSAAPSRINGAGWTFFDNDSYLGNTDLYAQSLGNLLAFGAIATSAGSAYKITMGPAITPTEANQIDKKIDDGTPAYGRVLAQKIAPSTVAPLCTTSNTDATALYNMSNLTKVCGLLMSLSTK